MRQMPKFFTNAYAHGHARSVSLIVKYPFFYDFSWLRQNGLKKHTTTFAATEGKYVQKPNIQYYGLLKFLEQNLN